MSATERASNKVDCVRRIKSRSSSFHLRPGGSPGHRASPPGEPASQTSSSISSAQLLCGSIHLVEPRDGGPLRSRRRASRGAPPSKTRLPRRPPRGSIASRLATTSESGSSSPTGNENATAGRSCPARSTRKSFQKSRDVGIPPVLFVLEFDANRNCGPCLQLDPCRRWCRLRARLSCRTTSLSIDTDLDPVVGLRPRRCHSIRSPGERSSDPPTRTREVVTEFMPRSSERCVAPFELESTGSIRVAIAAAIPAVSNHENGR